MNTDYKSYRKPWSQSKAHQQTTKEKESIPQWLWDLIYHLNECVQLLESQLHHSQQEDFEHSDMEEGECQQELEDC